MGQPVDGRSDLFSAGVILYQFLTGEQPFSGSATTIMHKVLKEDPLPPSTLNVQVPRPIDARRDARRSRSGPTSASRPRASSPTRSRAAAEGRDSRRPATRRDGRRHRDDRADRAQRTRRSTLKSRSRPVRRSAPCAEPARAGADGNRRQCRRDARRDSRSRSSARIAAIGIAVAAWLMRVAALRPGATAPVAAAPQAPAAQRRGAGTAAGLRRTGRGAPATGSPGHRAGDRGRPRRPERPALPGRQGAAAVRPARRLEEPGGGEGARPLSRQRIAREELRRAARQAAVEERRATSPTSCRRASRGSARTG